MHGIEVSEKRKPIQRKLNSLDSYLTLWIILLIVQTLIVVIISGCKDSDYHHLESRYKQIYKSTSPQNLVEFDKKSGHLIIYLNKEDVHSHKPEIIIYPDEIDQLKKIIDCYGITFFAEICDLKGILHMDLLISNLHDINHEIWDKLVSESDCLSKETSKNITVVIDPGHFAYNISSALAEQKFIIDSIGNILTHESKLTYYTSLIVKEILEKENIKVILTHEYGRTADGTDLSTGQKFDVSPQILV